MTVTKMKIFSVSNFKFLKTTGLIFLTQLLLISVKASNPDFNGIKGFKLKSCSDNQCISVRSEIAYVGHFLKNGYAFDLVQFNLKVNNSDIISFESNDVFYDMITQRILFRDVKSMIFKQAVYDFNEGSLLKL